ncbi:MAG: enoyl-CoA hydratase-related protein [Trebonia sp.]
MTSFQTLRTDVSDRVATIWLNRPERRNAFSSVMTRELYEAFALFESAEDVRAIVVTGTGRYFSAGADLERGGQTFNRPADAAPAATDPAGRIFSGTEAAEMGLVSRALPAADVLPAAQEFARDLADNTSAVSVAATKALVYGALERGRGAAHEREHEVFRWMGRQADAAEGVTAFLEKRAPQWPLSKVKDYPPMLSE